MTTAEWIVAIVGPAGLAALIPRAMKEFRAWRSGRAEDEKRANRSALGRLVEAETETEFQTEWRRLLSEHAAHVRRIAIDWGVPENVLPEWPKPPARQKV